MRVRDVLLSRTLRKEDLKPGDGFYRVEDTASAVHWGDWKNRAEAELKKYLRCTCNARINGR
jgi:hypothetical protein